MGNLPGSPIDGSKLVRAYCPYCGEPMRVTIETWHSYNIGKKDLPSCSDCNRPPIGAGHPGGDAYTIGDSPGPWQENAIRLLEDN